MLSTYTRPDHEYGKNTIPNCVLPDEGEEESEMVAVTVVHTFAGTGSVWAVSMLNADEVNRFMLPEYAPLPGDGTKRTFAEKERPFNVMPLAAPIDPLAQRVALNPAVQLLPSPTMSWYIAGVASKETGGIWTPKPGATHIVPSPPPPWLQPWIPLSLKLQARQPQSVATVPVQMQLPLPQMLPGIRLQFVLHPPQWTLF
jgi:hypothetical protein